jgi:hypothetical protein
MVFTTFEREPTQCPNTEHSVLMILRSKVNPDCTRNQDTSSVSLRAEIKHQWTQWLGEDDSRIGRRKTKTVQLCYLTGSEQLLSGHDFLHFCFLGNLPQRMEDKPTTTTPDVIVRDYH